MSYEQTKLLKKIQQVGFTIWEYHLFLDTHPDKKDIVKKLDEKKKELEMLTTEYEEKYAPITHDDKKGDSWAWLSDPWPWENEKEEN